MAEEGPARPLGVAAPTLDPEFVALLACPACDDRPPLRLTEVVPAGGAAPRLVCDRCGRAYPISPEGIPILLPEEAEMPATAADR
jgi:uncharacterized protein YbaR (Trm112 family)